LFVEEGEIVAAGEQHPLDETRVSRRTVLKLFAASLGTVSVGGILSACGPDDAASFNATKQAEAPSGGGENGGGGGATEGEHLVEMNDQFKFDPERIEIAVGETIVWHTVGVIPHTATCDPSKAQNPDHAILPDGAEPFDSGNIPQNEEFRHTFDVAGEYTYFCIPHEAANMIGHITVS
jgi:plastocyanin